MRITYLTPNLKISGGVKVKLEHCTRLADRGHQVTLVVTSPKALKVGWFPLNPKVKIVGLKAGQLKSQLPDADILIANHWPYCQDLPLSKGRLLTPRQIEEPITKKERKAMVRVPDMWLPNSPGVQEILMQQGFAHQYLVPNGINHEWFHPRGREDNVHIFTHFNVKKRRKGAPETLAVLGSIHNSFPEVKITGFGQVASSKIATVPSWMKFVSIGPKQLGKLYRKHGIYFYGALLDGFANSPLEAMACGCAVVTSLNAGTYFYAEHDKSALTYLPKNIGQAIEHLTRLIESAKLRKRIAAGGREAARIYDWQRTVDLLEDAMKSVCA